MRPPSFILPHKATAFTQVIEPAVGCRAPPSPRSGEGVAEGDGWGVESRALGPQVRGNVRATVWRRSSGPHPIRRFAPPSPASWGRDPRGDLRCEHCSPEGEEIAPARWRSRHRAGAPGESAGASPSPSSGARIRWTGIGHQPIGPAGDAQAPAGGSPFSAKRGRCRVAADGVRKAGMDRRRFAMTVVQSDLARSSGPHPIRRFAPPSPASWGRGPREARRLFSRRDRRAHVT